MKKENEVMNYDLELVMNGNRAIQEVILTFAEDDYRLQKTLTVGGNCTGLTVIEAAISNFFNELSKSGREEVELVREDGEILILENDGLDECWLENMLIKAEIISITAYKGDL